MQDVVAKAAIDWAIGTMTPVDPMSYKPTLTAAYNVLQHTNARIKHIIVLGDGDAENSYSALVTRIHKAGITISTVATGRGTYGFGADYGTMQCVRRSGARSPAPCPGPVGAARLVTPGAGPRRSPAS
jgi:hypothetical protein